MTPAQFRRLALQLPDAIEGEHMSHPDFRVGGRIFATLAADGSYGVVMLDAEQQQSFVDAEATAFIPAAGAWGLRGCTKVMLRSARAPTVRAALDLAWKNISAKAKKQVRTGTANPADVPPVEARAWRCTAKLSPELRARASLA